MKRLGCVIILVHFVLEFECVSNNICPTYDDYYTVKDNPNCWYDFTADSNATEIVIKHGYPLEIHRVVTPDGYILTVFRIPNYNSPNAALRKTPVFLQHGLASTSANFLGKGKDSLAFILADAGYDVWLGNFRGTEYSEGHVNLTVADKRYWDHSMDEIGLLDIPMQLELVAEKTGQRGNIIYIGHSLGTTVGLIYGSWYPHQAKETVKLFILLAPAAYLSNMLSPARFMAPFADQLYRMMDSNDMIRIGSQAEPLRNMIQPFCLESPVLMRRCLDMLNMLYGPKTQMGPDMIPIYFKQLPAGTSLKVTRHAGDMVLNNFRKYDHGINNMKVYGTYLPPIYDVSKIEVPVFIMYAVNDWTCTKRDSLVLYRKLPKKAKVYGIHEITEPNFNHIDFLFGKNVKSLVYDNILALIEKLNQN
ncbi:hypothetical protein ILUMI_07707 [Ignelater luminosus]|uniref:Lipase n=1 Tax=Ignelater luminosus TaxID=2038154 RepID=A0A8K0GE46_IGNLU|nr:hypothetical protein ILUMI_07707 [Ignelater luminosus]